MKIFCGLFLMLVLFLTYSCGQDSETVRFTGRWRADIVEKNTSTLVELRLQDKGGTLQGEFEILGETGKDVDKGMRYDIVQVEQSGNDLKFIVPLAGKIDEDSIRFELTHEGKHLKGYGQEMFENSEKIPVSFRKQ